MLPQAHHQHEKLVVKTDKDVTQAVLQMAEHIAALHFPNKMHWTPFWDRLDGAVLPNGMEIDLGDQYNTPALDKIKSHIKRVRDHDHAANV